MKISSFLRPAIIMPLPSGQTPDPTGANAQIGFMQNANNYSQQMASYATTGNAVTVLPADVVDGILQMNTGASAGFTINLPATDQILGAMTGAVALDGSFTKIVRVVNNNAGQTGTLTAGDGKTTITGTATVATNASRDYAMRVGPGSTLNFTNLGVLTL